MVPEPFLWSSADLVYVVKTSPAQVIGSLEEPFATEKYKLFLSGWSLKTPCKVGISRGFPGLFSSDWWLLFFQWPYRVNGKVNGRVLLCRVGGNSLQISIKNKTVNKKHLKKGQNTSLNFLLGVAALLCNLDTELGLDVIK